MNTVGDLLKVKGPGVTTVEPDVTVLDAARRMNENRIGALVVCDGGRVGGIFTERDVLNRVVAAGRDPAATRVRDVMTAPVACCSHATTLDECRRVMREKRIRHLPAVNDSKLVGMISIGDLNEFEITEQGATIQYLSDYLYGRT